MDDELAASLQRVSDAGHSVTLLSLADAEFSQNLGRIRVYNLASVMKSLEARAQRWERRVLNMGDTPKTPAKGAQGAVIKT